MAPLAGCFTAMFVWIGLVAPGAGYAAHPAPGSAGVGDRLFPTLGNGGYDVLHYDLNLRYATSSPSQPIDGTVTILARATESLSRFDLDFAGRSVGMVSVNGLPARWTEPTAPSADPATTAFFFTASGSATSPQPNYGHYVFPSNDHPSDKATFRFTFDVPTGVTAVANGLPTGWRSAGSRTIWTYVQRQPMATELVQLAVGRYDVTSPGSHPGVLLRDVTEPTLTEFMRPKLALEPRQIEWMENQVGRYPFDAYGSLVVEPRLSFALETQTLSLYDKSWFTELPQAIWEPVMVHELSHHWFGNSVSPAVWSDLWLNEGHATWYEQRFAANFYGSDFEAYMRNTYAIDSGVRAAFGPPAMPKFNNIALFSPSVYGGGALVLYALRQRIGAPAFLRLERAWVNRYRDASASTADFIALASRIAGQDLSSFLYAWLYGDATPPMPGHPDWSLATATATASRASAPRRAATALGRRR
jgi:aminopeptidase N